jgi:hypothetical protein
LQRIREEGCNLIGESKILHSNLCRKLLQHSEDPAPIFFTGNVLSMKPKLCTLIFAGIFYNNNKLISNSKTTSITNSQSKQLNCPMILQSPEP